MRLTPFLVRLSLILSAVLVANSSRDLFADVIWNEAVNSDLSSNNLAPTNLGGLAAGTHNVIGTATTVSDRDFWTIQIPSSHRLDRIILEGFIDTDNQGFFAVISGTSYPSLTDGSILLGGTLIGSAAGRTQGSDILDDLSANTSSQGSPSRFTPPLGAGTYSFWIQERDGTMQYNFRFEVSQIPEPTAFMLIGFAGCSLAFRRSRNS